MRNIFSKKGFTLVESLIAIAILMIAIAGPLSISEKSLSTSYISRDQMTATFLAEEAFESVKNIRDQVHNSATTQVDWLFPFVSKDCMCKISDNNCDLNLSGAKYCNIDATNADMINNGIISWSDSSALVNPLKLKKDADGNFLAYDLQSSEVSKFSRYINIYKTPVYPVGTLKSDEALVSVKISWQGSSGPQSIYLKSYIYNY